MPQKCATGIAKAGFAKRCGRWFFPVRVMMVLLERQRLPYTAQHENRSKFTTICKKGQRKWRIY
ncbi:MAG: hypothetical protein ACOCPA_00370 [Segatella copri]